MLPCCTPFPWCFFRCYRCALVCVCVVSFRMYIWLSIVVWFVCFIFFFFFSGAAGDRGGAIRWWTIRWWVLKMTPKEPRCCCIISNVKTKKKKRKGEEREGNERKSRVSFYSPKDGGRIVAAHLSWIFILFFIRVGCVSSTYRWRSWIESSALLRNTIYTVVNGGNRDV